MGKSYITMSEFIENAIEFEIESAEFYADLRSRVNNTEVKILLQNFEDQEKSHAETLKNYTVDESEDPRLQFGPTMSLNMPSAPEDKDIPSLFEYAIGREEKSARLYDFASDFAAAPFKDLLSSLAEFERGHKRDLKRLKQKKLR